MKQVAIFFLGASAILSMLALPYQLLIASGPVSTIAFAIYMVVFCVAFAGIGIIEAIDGLRRPAASASPAPPAPTPPPPPPTRDMRKVTPTP